ncbi:MAG: bifunctional phosphoribosylaminoimidazolecarboxamide formyltransferase/IMP cyclohydrolase, partial [Bifidobacterium sp.]
MPDSYRPIHRALVSIFHKEGIEVLARSFKDAGTEVVSTGSTAKRLEELGVDVIPVEQVTGFPESLDGRVKTLDPHIHSGILADMTNPEHRSQLSELGIKPFDLVVVNLYPFADTVRSGADDAQVIEKIDIGGPSMIRGAAKNHASVAVITDPADYALAADRVLNGKGFSLEERRWLAAKAFAQTSAYDATIAEWTSSRWSEPETVSQKESGADTASPAFSTTLSRTWDLAHTLRYGENPHQQAALYVDPLNQTGFAHAEQLGGKPMSYNNYVDADSAWRSVWDFVPSIAVAVDKHSNPCGLAIGKTVAEAHRKAHACDPMSAYGGVIAANTTVSLEMAQQIKPIFTEVIVAPDYDDDALALLQTKKNLRILKVANPPRDQHQLRQIDGGMLVQGKDLIDAPGDGAQSWKIVARRQADETTMRDLKYAWRAIRAV